MASLVKPFLLATAAGTALVATLAVMHTPSPEEEAPKNPTTTEYANQNNSVKVNTPYIAPQQNPALTKGSPEHLANVEKCVTTGNERATCEGLDPGAFIRVDPAQMQQAYNQGYVNGQGNAQHHNSGGNLLMQYMMYKMIFDHNTGRVVENHYYDSSRATTTRSAPVDAQRATTSTTTQPRTPSVTPLAPSPTTNSFNSAVDGKTTAPAPSAPQTVTPSSPTSQSFNGSGSGSGSASPSTAPKTSSTTSSRPSAPAPSPSRSGGFGGGGGRGGGGGGG